MSAGADEMAHWNYRVVGRSRPTGADDFEEEYGIIEAYYDAADVLRAWAEVPPHGGTVEELRADLNRMLEATEKPVVDESALPKP